MSTSTSVPRERKIPPAYASGAGDPTRCIGPGFYSFRIRNSIRVRNHFQRGQATLEILIVLLILIPLIFGGIELSRGVAVRSALDSGVSVMVQAVSIDPNQWGWSAVVVQETVDQNVFGSAGLDPTVHLAAVDINSIPIDDLTTQPFGTAFCIVGSIGYSPLIPLVPTSPITIKVTHCGIIQKLDT